MTVFRQAEGELCQEVGCLGVLVGEWRGESLGLWIERVRESWAKELGDWVCWWLSGGSELGAVDIDGEGELG